MTSSGDLHRIASLLRAIRNAVAAASKATVDAIREQTKAYQKANEPEPTGQHERVRIEVNFSEEQAGRYYSEQDKSYRLQRRTFWVNVLTFLAIVIYACITYKQWRTMDDTFIEIRKQNSSARIAANAAKSAAETAAGTLGQSKESFQIQQRPYIVTDTKFRCCTYRESASQSEHSV